MSWNFLVCFILCSNHQASIWAVIWNSDSYGLAFNRNCVIYDVIVTWLRWVEIFWCILFCAPTIKLQFEPSYEILALMVELLVAITWSDLWRHNHVIKTSWNFLVYFILYSKHQPSIWAVIRNSSYYMIFLLSGILWFMTSLSRDQNELKLSKVFYDTPQTIIYHMSPQTTF